MVGEGKVTAEGGWLDVIARCHCSMVWLSGWGVITGCHWSVLWWGRVTANFGGVDGDCRQSAMIGGKDNNQLWGSGCDAIAGCHCSVL